MTQEDFTQFVNLMNLNEKERLVRITKNVPANRG